MHTTTHSRPQRRWSGANLPAGLELDLRVGQTFVATQAVWRHIPVRDTATTQSDSEGRSEESLCYTSTGVD